jgi:hypothetical protein
MAPEVKYIWGWFMELCAVRQAGMNGLLPTSNLEIQAWAALRQITLSTFEFDALRALDGTYLNATAKPQK